MRHYVVIKVSNNSVNGVSACTTLLTEYTPIQQPIED